MKISKKSIGIGIAVGLLLWAGLNFFSGKPSKSSKHNKVDTLVVFCGFIDPYTNHARIDSAAVIIKDSAHIIEDDQVVHRRDSIFFVTEFLPLADPTDPLRIRHLKAVSGQDSVMVRSIPIPPSSVFQIWGTPVVYHAPVQPQPPTTTYKPKDTVSKKDSVINRRVVK